jgi:hypothetical protein
MAANKPGLLVLINNIKFDALGARKGSEIDEDHLKQFFGNCGFNVTDEIHRNQTCAGIRSIALRG